MELLFIHGVPDALEILEGVMGILGLIIVFVQILRSESQEEMDF